MLYAADSIKQSKKSSLTPVILLFWQSAYNSSTAEYGIYFAFNPLNWESLHFDSTMSRSSSGATITYREFINWTKFLNLCIRVSPEVTPVECSTSITAGIKEQFLNHMQSINLAASIASPKEFRIFTDEKFGITPGKATSGSLLY
jgi:hypothetical protein